MASKSLVLIKSRTSVSPDNIANIWKFFNLESDHRYLQRLVSLALYEKSKQIPRLAISVDPVLQDLFIGILKINMKVWHRPLGSLINSILKKEISKKLKSVLLSHFFEEFNLPRELEFMQQFGITNE